VTGTPPPTWTCTNTQINTNTLTPTFTEINTTTFISTSTLTITFTSTNTPIFILTNTPTETWTEQQTGIDKPEIIISSIVIYPNPLIIKDQDLKIIFNISKGANRYVFKVFTKAYRFILENKEEKKLVAGRNEITLKNRYLRNLSNGIYYGIIEIEDDKGNKIKSHIQEFIILYYKL